MAREQARTERENAAAKAARQAQFQADRDAQTQRHQEALAAQVEPRKTYHRRQWLAHHPHFERRAWPRIPRIKRTLIEALERNRQEAQVQAFRQGVGGVRSSF